MSIHVSLYQGMRSFIGFPNNNKVDLIWEPGNHKQTIYFAFVITTRYKSAYRHNCKITWNEIVKSISCDYLTSRRNVEKWLIIDTEASINKK